MERFCESVLTLTGSLGLLLTTDGRLLVMLSLTNLSDNASSRALPLESPQSTFQGFILTNTDLRHLVSLPSAQSFDVPLRQTRRQWSTVRLIIAQQSLFVNRILSFSSKLFRSFSPRKAFCAVFIRICQVKARIRPSRRPSPCRPAHADADASPSAARPRRS